MAAEAFVHHGYYGLKWPQGFSRFSIWSKRFEKKVTHSTGWPRQMAADVVSVFSAAFSSAMGVPLPLPSPLKLNMSDTLVGRSTSSLSWLFLLKVPKMANNGVSYLYFLPAEG